MNEVDAILKKIMGSAHENEVIEFKDRKNLSKDELGKYFSALSNEANLKNQSAAWIIFGIDDSGTITNSNYLSSQESQNEIKRYISEQSSGHLSFKEIFTRYVEGKRLLLFEVPPASFGTPTSFKGFAYERQGDSLLPLSEFKRLKSWKSRFLIGANRSFQMLALKFWILRPYLSQEHTISETGLKKSLNVKPGMTGLF